MRKMTILGMGNSSNYNYLIVKKQKGFFEWLANLLNLGIEPKFFNVQSYSDKNDNYKEKPKKLKISQIFMKNTPTRPRLKV